VLKFSMILEAAMKHHAKGQESEANRRFSKLDWPTPEMLQAANRARARAMCDMIMELGKWAKTAIAGYLISKQPRDTNGSRSLPAAPKR
jgi:hypothetical protein